MVKIVIFACTIVCAAGHATVAQIGAPFGRLARTNLLTYHDRHGAAAVVHSISDWQKRRAEILCAFQQIAGPLPEKEKRCALEVRILSETNCGAYVRQSIDYLSEPGARVAALILIPNELKQSWRTKLPAILALHPTDMEYGNRVVTEQLRRDYTAYGAELAERGYVVLAPSYPLMAAYQPDLKRLGYKGGTMKAIWDNIRSLDLLEALPKVDRRNIGAIGHSLGGHNAIFTALFDQRIKVLAVSCGFDSFVDYKGGNIEGWTSERYMPRLLEYRIKLDEIPFDFAELIGALAPRALFINAPLHDSNFSCVSVEGIVKSARPVYKLFHVENNLQVEHPNCGHEFPVEQREQAYRLFDEVLKHPRAARN